MKCRLSSASLGSFPHSSVVKESICNAGDLDLLPGSGKSPGEGNGNTLQYCCLKNPMTEEPSRLQSMGLQESDTTYQLNHHQFRKRKRLLSDGKIKEAFLE